MPTAEYKTEKQRKMLEEHGVTAVQAGGQTAPDVIGAAGAVTGALIPYVTSKPNIPYKTEKQRRMLAAKGLAEWTDEEKRELSSWAGIGKRGYESLRGYVTQLGKDDWKSLSSDRFYRQGLGQQIQEAQNHLKGLNEDSLTYKDASEYLSYLQELQKAFDDRASYYGQFKDEEEFDIIRGISAGRDKAKTQGKSYNDYYLGTEQDAAKADEAYQAAQQKKAQMQQDVNNQRQYLSRTGILLVNGQVLRGKAAEDYLQQQQDAVNSVDTEIQQRAQEAEYAKKFSGYAKAGRYADLADLPDYNVRLAQGGRAWAEEQARVNAGKASERDIAINANLMPNNGLGGVSLAAAAQVMRNDTSSREPQADWTEEERNTFLILFQRSPEEAYDYAIEINSRNANISSAAQAQALSKWTNENGWRRAAAWGAGVLSQPFAAADYLDRVMQNNIRGYVMPHSQLTPADAADTMSAAAARYLNDTYGTIGEGTPVLGGKGWGDVFQLSQSIAQSAAAATMGGGATNLLFFGSAANQGYQDAKNRGASDGEALILGFLNGSAEVLGETFSVEKLIKIKNPATMRRYLWNAVKQGGIEASEEAFTTILNTFADEIVMGDKSELQQNIRQLMAQGMSRAEAEKQAWQEWAEGLAGDALGGFLSGGISAGGRQAIGMIRSSSFAYSGEDAQRLVEAGLQQKAGSAAYKLAQKIQEQGTMSELEAQRLTDLLGEDAEVIHRNQRAELVQEAQRRLQEAGMGQRSAARSAETVTRELLGEELDRAGRADRERDFRSETVRQVTQQMQQERRMAAIQRWQQAQQTRTQIKTGTNVSEQLQKAFKASKLEISQEDLEILRDGYGGGQRMNAYVIAMRDGYRLGKLGMDYDKAADTSDYSGKVMPLQFQHAWELGMKAGGHELPDRFLNRKAELGSAQRSDAVTVKGQSGDFTMQGLTRGADGTLTATVKAADGSEQSVSLESLDFGDSGMGDLVQVLKGRSDAEQMFAAYKDGMNIGSFVRGWDTAKAYGQATGNRTVESVLKDSMLEDLDEKTIRAAFAYGRSLKEQQKAARGKSGPSQSQSDSSPRRGESQEASGKGEGGVSYDGGTVDGLKLRGVNRNRLTPKQRAQIRVIETLGKKFGIEFRLFESSLGKNGRYQSAYGMYMDGVIYLDVNAGRLGQNMGQVALVRTAAHELTHYIQDHAEERYQELQEFLLDYLVEWKGKDLGQMVAEKMLRDRTGKLTSEQALDEVVADGCEMMLRRTKVMQAMAEQKPNLFQAVKEWMQEWIQAVKEAFLGVSEVHDEARAVAQMETERLEKLVELWDKGLMEASERAAKSPAREGGAVKYSIDPNFEKNLSAWIEDGRKTGARIRVGTTSKALQSIDIPEMNIYWWSNSIIHAQDIHKEISDRVLKQVPSLIENPIVIMESKTQPNSITILGEVYGENEIPVLAVLRFKPSKDGVSIDKLEIINSYTKTKPDAEPTIKGTQKLINTSTILYVDPDKKRTDTWLNSNRLQLPFVTTYGPIAKITLAPRDVKGHFSADTKTPTKTPMQLAFEKAAQKQEREDLPDDRALLMQARAEGRNAETLTAYQKKVRSLEALERKLRRQQEGLEAAKNHEEVDEKGEPLPPEEQKKFSRQTMNAVQEQIRKTEDSIRRAEQILAKMEQSPQIRQETEKALAAWREANPNDAARAIREMQQERDTMRKYVDLLRQEARLTTPESRRMLPSDILKLARNLVKEHGSSAAVDQIAEALQELGDFMVEHMQGGGVGYFNQLTKMAQKIARSIVSESYETIDENKEIREGIRSYLKNHTLKISDDVRGDIPDFNAWRKKQMGTLWMGNEGMDIDQAYQDLRSEFGDGLFPEDVLSRSDQLMQILEALRQVQPTYQQIFSQMDQEQVAAALGNEIVDRLLSKEVREKETMADKAFQRRMQQLEEKYARKDKARQQALENAEDRAAWEARKRDEAEERRREERALRRQLVAEKVHELRERSIERDKKYRGRIAIDKKVVALSKIMLENSGKRHVPDAWKEAIGNFLASIDTLTQRSGEGSRSFHVERIEALREMVRKQQLANEGREERGEEQGPQVFLDINPYLADMLKPFVAMARDSSTGTIQVENLEVEQMKELEEVLTAIREAVDKSDVMLAAAEKGETLSKTAGETIRHLESLGKGKTGNIIRRFLSWDNLTPVYFFKRFGAGGERVFRELQNGWGKLAMNAKQIIDFSNATYTAKEAREWEQEVHEFKLIRRESDLSGRESLTKAAAEGGAEAAKAAEERNKETVKLSTAQIMGLYCLVKREQALGHILGGGIRIWDITAKPTLKDRITGENVQEQAERYLVDEEDIAKITGTLTARQKEVADKLQRYMNTVGSAWGNEVSQARYGVDLFGEQNYYPIVTDPKSRNARTPDADGSDLYHILNMGFTKTPEKNARNGIVVHSIFDVFSNHMADMAKYNSMGLPMLDAMKWFNYLDETNNSFTSVRGAMERALGKNAELYFMGLIQDLNGNFEGGRRGEDIASKMISHSKVASVGANLRVAALQPTSYVRALAVLDPKYLLKGDNPAKIRQGIREALQYSGTAVWKDLGFFDLNINTNMRDMIKHTDGALENIREKSMWGAEMGDKTTWGRLWNATKAEVQDKTGLTGEALLKATAERFDDVIYQTQVMDSTMTRSHLMRQKGAFASMVTSFMSEPTLSYNLLLDAVSNWEQTKRSGKAVKQASLMAARAFTVYALSQVAASIVESIFSAMRDDDDYESFWEKWKQAEFGWDGNLVQDLVLHNKLPYVRDVVSILEGWTNKRMDTEWVEDLTKAYTAVKRDMENGEFRWGTAYAAMTALSTVTGLPIANTARDAVALWNTLVVQSVPDWKLKTVKRGTVTPAASIKQAFQAGAISEEDAIRYLMRDAEIETEEKARQKLYEWGLEKGMKKYDKLLDAVRSGQDSKAARDELLQAGFSEDSLRSEVRSAVKAWYQGTAEDGRPRIEKDEAIRMLVKEGGMSQRDAEAKVREWSSFVSSPEKLQYEDIQDAFIAGEITAARAAEMRMLYGGESKSDAQKEVLQWQCEKDTGIAFKDLKDAWLDGEISDAEAVEYQVKYGGKTKVKAEQALQQWRYVKDTGGDYSDVKQAFLEGALSAEDAIAARVDYGGQTKTDAQKEIRKWSCEKETGVNYDDMHDLYLSGELSAERAAQLRQTYGGETKTDAQAEVRKWSCEKETGIVYNDIQDLYLSGEVSGSRAADLRVKYGGASQEDAEKEVLQWQCEKDTGIRYKDIRDAYAGGQISEEKVRLMLQKYGGYSETEAEGKTLQYRFAGKNAEMADISPKAATTYYGSLEAAGVSKEVWYKTWRTESTTQGDKKANGKTISGSKKNKMVAYIHSLNLTPAQKDALYLALDYAKSGIRNTPWH